MKNQEVAHLWAGQKKERANTRHLFFEGKSIYSYGHHYEIARFIKSNIILLNSKPSSATTEIHKNHVIRAIPDHYIGITVPKIGTDKKDIKENILHLTTEINTYMRKYKKATKYGLDYIKTVEMTQQHLKIYCQIYKRVVPKNYRGVLISEKEKAECTAKNIIRRELEQYNYRMAKIKDEKEFFENLEKWSAGENVYLHSRFYHEHTVRLRIHGTDIQTSQGASVPTNEALVLYLKIRNGDDIKGFEIGNYTVIGIEDNILKIGCHKIPLEEVNRVGEILRKSLLKQVVSKE